MARIAVRAHDIVDVRQTHAPGRNPLTATAAPKVDTLSFPKKPAAELLCYSCVINSLRFSLPGENCNETRAALRLEAKRSSHGDRRHKVR
jgi:hypothetical protein